MAKRCAVDWFRLLCDFKLFNITGSYSKVSSLTGIPASTLADIKAGKQPRHEDGERLIKLWCAMTGGNRSDLPKVNRFSNHF